MGYWAVSSPRRLLRGCWWRERNTPRPRRRRQPTKSAEQSPWLALRRFPQGWLIAVVMLFLSATWTGYSHLFADAVGGGTRHKPHPGRAAAGFPVLRADTWWIPGWLDADQAAKPQGVAGGCVRGGHHPLRSPVAVDGVHHRAGAGMDSNACYPGAAFRVSRRASPRGGGADWADTDLHGRRILRWVPCWLAWWRKSRGRSRPG